jgi:hypothetical protein
VVVEQQRVLCESVDLGCVGRVLWYRVVGELDVDLERLVKERDKQPHHAGSELALVVVHKTGAPTLGQPLTTTAVSAFTYSSHELTQQRASGCKR